MTRRRDALRQLSTDAPTLTRRRVLGLAGAVAAGKAIDNVLIGYGPVTGTNLVDQDLAAVAAEGFLEDGRTAAGEYRLVLGDDALSVHASGGAEHAHLDLATATPADARAVDEELGLRDGPVEQAVSDLLAVRRGDYEFAFSTTEPFFERLRAGEQRPYTVGLVRGEHDGVDPDVVREFTGTSPRDPQALLTGLMTGFREYAGYDLERYAAGSIQDNVIFGAADLRAQFREPVDFETVMAEEGTGMFCYEFTRRSIDALHTAAVTEQSPPVAGATGYDRRHKHIYTAVVSVVRQDGDLVVPVTFVDYTHSTLYDDLALRGVMGEGLEAYGRRHRATALLWP